MNNGHMIPMNKVQREVFDWIAAHPNQNPVEIAEGLSELPQDVVFNAVYFLYFNKYILAPKLTVDRFSVNEFLTAEEIEPKGE
jgi:hypothetical protein